MEPTMEKPVSEQIDEICDEFEEIRHGGNSARIEDFLEKIGPEHQEKLFEELFEIEAEIQYGAASKEGRANSQILERFPEDYTERFPMYADIIQTIVRRVAKQRKIGDYEIISKLGHGGMGVVYKARQKHLNQVVAIKVLPHTLLHHRMAVERFRREMQLIGQLDHPNIVRALNAGELDGTQYLVMEFIDGINLQNAGEIGEPVPLGAACEIIRQAALGLQHAHEAGLVHRDIKPANLMLNFFGVVKVLDLGLGKFYAGKRNEDVQALTKTGTTMGTADYISPEQCENAEKVDIRADIYSLGCTFFHIATGCAPYSDSQYDSVRKKLNAHVDAEIPKLSQKIANVPPGLDKVFEKMLAKAPEDRFQNPLEVAEALEPYADFDSLLNYVETWKKKFGIILQNSSSRLYERRHDKKSTSRSNATIRTKMDTHISIPDGAKDWKFRSFLYLFPILFVLALPLLALLRGFLGSPETPQMKEQRESARINLAQLPGLNGDWWFEEIPWFIPPARHVLIQELSKSGTLHTLLGETPELYRDPNCAEVYNWLWDILSKNKAKLPDSQWTLIEALKAISDSDDNNQKSKEAIQTALIRFAPNPQQLNQPQNPHRAVDVHTLAILEHRIAILEDDKALAQTAMEWYQTANELYREEIQAAQEKNALGTDQEKENLELLSLLALADSARLQYLASGEYDKTFEIFENIRRSDIRKSSLFQAEMFAIYGALSAEAGQYRDDLFQLALDFVKPDVLGGRTHPLAGHVRERFAWSLVDQWKVKESKDQFEHALRVRTTNYEESNPYALIYVLHNKHGIALTERYLGLATQAERDFEKTIEEIDKAIQDAKKAIETNGAGKTGASIKREYLANLRERSANTRERYADCVLYGGAASGTNLGKFPQAIESYQQAAEFYDTVANKRIMSTKQAMILILQSMQSMQSGQGGQSEQSKKSLADGEQILKELDSQKDPNLGRLIRMKRIKQLADAVLNLAKNTEANTPELGRAALWEFLREMNPANSDGSHNYLNPIESTRRENLEMRIFCAELLLKSYWDQLDAQQAAGNDKAMSETIEKAERDLKQITDTLAAFHGNQEVRPFIRRFVHQLVAFFARSYEHTNDTKYLNWIARTLLQMRTPTGQRDDQIERDTSYFFFYLTNRPEEGFVLFLPEWDQKQAKLFRLPLTRSVVRQERAKIAPLDSEQFHLSELLKLVEREKAVGRKIVRSWDDSTCYSTSGLKNSDWPTQWGTFP